MSTQDYLYNQVELSQRSRTSRRREGRWRRRQVYLLGAALLLAAGAAGAPSLISHSSIGRGIVANSIQAYGLGAEVTTMRIGWITPLRITGLQIEGPAGSTVTIDQLNLDLTAGDFLASSLRDLGQIAVRGVEVTATMGQGRCSLEDDLRPLLDPSGPSGASTATIKIQDLAVTMTDQTEGRSWRLAQSNADVELAADRIQGSFAGVLSEPGGSGGSLQGTIEGLTGSRPADQASPWRLELHAESLPLSIVGLLRRRFPQTTDSIPAAIHGDATGAVELVGAADGAIEAAVRQLQVRNFSAIDEGAKAWNNRLATLDGDLILLGDRVIGRSLRATSDFAAATIDGAFSRSFSLVGVNDNPLRWLEAIDGHATVEADLAAMEQSLPGLLPLRAGAELISGRVVASVDSTVQGSLRRSQLSIKSNPIRARSQGRPVVIDPIELAATVSSDGGPLKAEQFEWKSSFGSAVGQGDLRSGNADVEVDFGRLTSMLRPIVEISESTLAGSVRGTIRWNAEADDAWRLSGQGQATNLVISMANGQTLRRPMMQGTVEAVGRWGGDALDELTRADVTLATGGLDVRAELVQAVDRPSADVPLPIRIVGHGRIDTLTETLGPWLPPQLHDAVGRFRASGRAEVSTAAARLTAADIEWTEARLAYNDRYFSQPLVKVHFDGDYAWPSSDLSARALTVAADAFSMAAQGSWDGIGKSAGGEVDMEVRWRAKLERLQGSVRRQIAASATPIRQVAFRSESDLQQLDLGADQWLVMGDCEGAIDLQTAQGMLNIDTHASGTNLAIVQPTAASAAYQTVGPMPTARTPGGSAVRQSSSPSGGPRAIWSEPQVKVDGWIRYDPQSGAVAADELQIAGNWLATTLSGDVLWNERTGDVRLQGPARLKMDQVAARLANLLGTPIDASGIHQTPVEIKVMRDAHGQVGLEVAANLGWEHSRIGGVTMGRASVPVRLTETSLEVLPVSIPVGEGRLNVAGEVHYRPGPLWMRLKPGCSATAIRLTPEMTDSWLQYLAPLAADTARIDGLLGIELDEALIVVDQPDQSRVVGRLNISSVEMTSGPLANQLYAGISQLKLLARQAAPSAADPAASHTLITMPAQTVDFALDQGVVQHNRMFFQVDRAEVVTSGRVAVDGRLNLFAQVPLDARWLGSDLQGLAGQPVTLPISGTLSQPRLDPSGVRQVVAELGARAAQQTAENYLQKQLGRGLDKLFGR